MVVVRVMAAVALFGVLLVLPGLAVRCCWASLRAGRIVVSVPEAEPLAIVVARAVGTSLVAVLLLGYSMLALSQFTDTRLALATVPLAVVGLVPMASLAPRLVRRGWLALPLAVLAIPFLAPALRPGYAPINNFNWYYWSLGRDLSVAQGIPSWVSEYGMHIRWQPDYLNFNLVSEGFRGMFAGSDMAALSMWKVPMALFTVFVVFAALRMWFSRPAAFMGTALLLVTTVFTSKLGNARPEILGLDLGLVAAILGLHAQRRLQPRSYVFAAAVLAIAFGIHAIGALPAALLLAMGTLCVIVSDRRLLAPRARMTLLGLVAFAFVVAATGWAFQGRVFVGSDATHPSLVNGSDPTLTYFKLSEGLARRPEVWHRLHEEAFGVLTTLTFAGWAAWAFVALLLACLALAVGAGPQRAREAALVTTGVALFLMAGTAWFGLRYHTFVPQNTGLSRFTQWSPLVYVLCLMCGVEAGGAWVRRTRLFQRRPWGRSSAGPAPSLALVGLLFVTSVGWASWVLPPEMPTRIPLSRDAAAAIDRIAEVASPGDVLLTNTTTHGILEFATPAEVPLEGRQPVIEKLAILEATNAYLRAVTRFFAAPEGHRPSRQFGARWVLVTDRPQHLGAVRTFGPPLRRLPGSTGLERVWHSAHISLYEADSAVPRQARVGPATDVLARSLSLSGGCLVVVVAVALFSRRPRSGRHGKRRGRASEVSE